MPPATQKNSNLVPSRVFLGRRFGVSLTNYLDPPIIMLLHFYTEPWLLQKEHMLIFLEWIRYCWQYLETGIWGKETLWGSNFRDIGWSWGAILYENRGHYKKPTQTIHDLGGNPQIGHTFAAWLDLPSSQWVPFNWLVRRKPIPQLLVTVGIVQDRRRHQARMALLGTYEAYESTSVSLASRRLSQ